MLDYNYTRGGVWSSANQTGGRKFRFILGVCRDIVPSKVRLRTRAAASRALHETHTKLGTEPSVAASRALHETHTILEAEPGVAASRALHETHKA